MSGMKELTLTANEQKRLQVLNQVMAREVAVGDAADVLGLSERHTWRLLAGYRKEGAVAVAHGNRGKPAANAIPDSLRDQVLRLAITRYEGLNQTHFTEMLAEREGLVLARSTVRNILRAAGIASPRRRRPPRHRSRRERMPQEGMLLQLDGSHHRWLQHRGPPLVLLLAIDDATGTAPYALFREREDTIGYLNLLKTIVECHGIPAAVYTDRHAAFIHRDSKTEAARVSVALKELGVRQILAMSPEAKGRVERANGTFQDRLVSELRLAGARTLEQANEVLWEFLPRFNARFGVPAAVPQCGYRSVELGVDIESVFSFKQHRIVARDNTVSYRGRSLQLLPVPGRTSFAGSFVEVQERLDGTLVIHSRGEAVPSQDAPPRAAALRKRKDAPLSGWWKDEQAKAAHRERVLAGMQHAWKEGKRIGRPPVIERPGFPERFLAASKAMESGSLSRRQAAILLGIGYATLKRLIDARQQQEALTESLNQRP
jgi:transposase